MKMVIMPLAQFRYMKSWAIEGLENAHGMTTCSYEVDPERYMAAEEMREDIKKLKKLKPIFLNE